CETRTRRLRKGDAGTRGHGEGETRRGLTDYQVTMQDQSQREMHATTAVVEPGLTFASVTDKISSIVVKRKTPLWWFVGFALSFMLFQLMMLAITQLLFVGIGVWGVNIPVAWGIDILNFVWWIGIGHAGTLISAILLLLRQKWRTSINR